MSAVISPCGRYRYRLERQGAGDGTTVVIMVNPSTADAEFDDPTIRKLIGFGQRNAWGRIVVGNLFAFRATDVRRLQAAHDPIGPDNDAHLRRMFEEADRLIYAWGPLAKQPRYHCGRWRHVHAIAVETGLAPLAIGEPAKDGHPKHPLMLPYAAPIAPWRVR